MDKRRFMEEDKPRIRMVCEPMPDRRYSTPIMQTRFLHTFVGLAAVSVGILGGGCHKDISDQDLVQLSAVEVNKRLTKEALVLDMRDEATYRQGHLPWARVGRLSDVDPTADEPRYPGYPLIVVYGQNPGSTAAKAMAKRLMINRNDNVKWMSGGFDEWMRFELPVEITDPPGD